MKGNPLFSDSTKIKGDRVTTELELHDIVLYEGEEVFIWIKNHLGIEREIALELNEGNIYKAMLWLNLQEDIEYRFLVKKNDEIKLHPRKNKAIQRNPWKSIEIERYQRKYKEIQRNTMKYKEIQ